MKKNIKFKGHFRYYMYGPILLTILLILMNIPMYLYEWRAGLLTSAFTVVYFIVVTAFYHRSKPFFMNELINFATQYGTVQKKLLNEFDVAYALIDYNGKILWVNEKFTELTGKDKDYHRSMQYCGDATVNAVLSVKEEQMEHYGIRLEAKIDIPKELPFEKRDICALFANALDNAAEACRKLEEDRRKIMLRSKAQKGLFCLEVTNPVESAARESDDGVVSGIRKEEGLPQTSKPDKENHGIGLRSMKEIVERYCGAMELKAEGEVFEVFLYMPLR